MIEVRRFVPFFFVVAGDTIISEPPLVPVVSPVAADAGARRLAEDLALLVALPTHQRAMSALEFKIGFFVIERARIEPCNVGVSPLVFRMAMAACAIFCNLIFAMEALPCLAVGTHFVMAIQAQSCLRLALEGGMALVATFPIFLMPFDQRARHHQLFKNILCLACRGNKSMYRDDTEDRHENLHQYFEPTLYQHAVCCQLSQ